jgi:hypothetical protein
LISAGLRQTITASFLKSFLQWYIPHLANDLSLPWHELLSHRFRRIQIQYISKQRHSKFWIKHFNN